MGAAVYRPATLGDATRLFEVRRRSILELAPPGNAGRRRRGVGERSSRLPEWSESFASSKYGLPSLTAS